MFVSFYYKIIQYKNNTKEKQVVREDFVVEKRNPCFRIFVEVLEGVRLRRAAGVEVQGIFFNKAPILS
jgi:hypothetical protein